MKIAYLMSVYSGDKFQYFEKAIQSVINQEISQEIELRIYLGIDGEINPELINTINKYDKYIFKIIKSKENIGLAAILNLIINNLNNEKFLFRMDSDDICLPHRTQIQIDFLIKNPDCIAVGSSFQEINELGVITGFKKAFSSKDIYDKVYYRNPFNHPTMALRGDFFNLVGTYNPSLKKSQDYELWMRALNLGFSMKNIKEPLLLFRKSSDFLKKRNSFQNVRNEFLISFNFILNTKKYRFIPLIVAKLLVRLMPQNFSKIAYKIIRK